MEPACVREDSMENTVALMPVEDRVAMIMVCVKTWLRETKIDLITSANVILDGLEITATFPKKPNARTKLTTTTMV